MSSGALAKLGQVLADAEAAAGAGDDDGAHLRVARLLERGREASCIARLNALSTSGRLSVSVRTPPSRVISTSGITGQTITDHRGSVAPWQA